MCIASAFDALHIEFGSFETLRAQISPKYAAEDGG
jgi:hypothetical protein